MHLVYPQKFCITIVFDFLCDDLPTYLPEIGRNRYTKFGRGGGGGGGWPNKVHHGLCENGELARWSAGTDLREFFSS